MQNQNLLRLDRVASATQNGSGDVVDAADEILSLARKLVEIDQQIAPLQAERDRLLVSYRQRIKELRGDDPVEKLAQPESDFGPLANLTLRERIEGFLAQHAGVPMSLDEIQKSVGIGTERRKIIWTLANMKRDGVVKREGRGLWSSEPEPEVLDEIEI
jgi:hypothetical protein